MPKALTREQTGSLFEEYKNTKDTTTYTLSKKYGWTRKAICNGFKRHFKEEFELIRKCKYRKLSPGDVDKICRLYEGGDSLKIIARKFNLNFSTVLDHLKRNGIKIRSPRDASFLAYDKGRGVKHRLQESSKIMTKEKGYILGVMCGDGYLHQTKNNSYQVGLNACDKDFVLEFARCLKEVYNIEPIPTLRERTNPNWNKIWVCRLCSKEAYEDILSCGSFRTKTWKIPETIFASTEEIKQAFIKGFFDSEGCVESTKRITGVSVNRDGIYQMQRLLETLNIKSHITQQYMKGNRQPLYSLRITGMENVIGYKEIIGFSIKRKLEKLENCTGEYRIMRSREEIGKLKNRMVELRNQNISYQKIGEMLGIGMSTVWVYVNKPKAPCVQPFVGKE